MFYSAGVLVVVSALGLWLGLFETFGGYENRQRGILLLGTAIGVCGGIHWSSRSTKPWRSGLLFLLCSWLLFQTGNVIGEALYFGPESVQIFGRLVILAIQNEL